MLVSGSNTEKEVLLSGKAHRTGISKQAAAGSRVRAEAQGLLGAKVATDMNFQ